jgi:site-specific DNA-methyltransferase (adenine-specific)
MSFERVEIGNAVLYRGDCAEVLPTLAKVDAVITDPPYGIGAASRRFGNGTASAVDDLYGLEWDAAPPSDAEIAAVVAAGDLAVLWGGNYFGLPAARCWLVWDKCTGDNSYADAELAWTNLQSVVKLKRLPWIGASAKDTPDRVHPTQKPVLIMAWAIRLAGKPATVLDPYMGSGTTGVAAAQIGCRFIDIEREPKYFDIACRRIEQAMAQGKLFGDEPAQQPEQMVIA